MCIVSSRSSAGIVRSVVKFYIKKKKTQDRRTTVKRNKTLIAVRKQEGYGEDYNIFLLWS